MINGTTSKGSPEKRSDILEKRLTYVSWMAFVLAVSMTMAIIIILRDKKSSNNVCLSSSCVLSSATILKNVDINQNPCENFYKFSCGNYLKEIFLQNDQICLNNFQLLKERIERQMKKTIDDPLPLNASKPYRQLKLIYNHCMNTTAIEREDIHTVRDLIDSVGSCPLLKGNVWNSIDFHWTNLIYKLREKGFKYNHFITLKVAVDERDSLHHILTIDQTTPIFTAINSTSGSLDVEYLTKIVTKFGGSIATSKPDLEKVLEFDAKLASICIRDDHTMNRSTFYNPMTIRELQYRFSKVDWMQYIINVVGLSDVTFSYKETIIVRTPQYLSNLETLLGETSIEVQANYIIISTLVSLIPLLTKNLRKLQTTQEITHRGFIDGESRWKECLYVAQNSLSLPFYALYMKKYFKSEDYKQIKEILLAVQDEFRIMLNESEWLDEITRKAAVDKLNATLIRIGFPNQLQNDKIIDNYYSKLHIDTSSYLKAMLSVDLFLQHKHFCHLRQLVSETDWIDDAITNNIGSLYSLTQHRIHITEDMLQGIFFNSNRPRYINYATVGSLIGNEITHGFDDIGRQYDKHGNINDWWGTRTEALFVEKAHCMLNKNPNFTQLRTQVEIMANIGGLKQSYFAYDKWTRRNDTERQLGGVQYSQKQLFWISAAQLWCEKLCVRNAKINDLYNTPEYRINEVFSNSPNFSKDFNCPLGSSMNPELKCSIW